MRTNLNYLSALEFLLRETFVILYWLGLWSLFTMTSLLDSVWFNMFCLLAGALGVFLMKAIEKPFILLEPRVRATKTQMMQVVRRRPALNSK